MTQCYVMSPADTQFNSYIASLLEEDAIGGRVYKIWKTPNSESFTVLKCIDSAHTYWALKSDFDLRERSVPLIPLSPAASPQTLEGAFSRQRASSSRSSSSSSSARVNAEQSSFKILYDMRVAYLRWVASGHRQLLSLSQLTSCPRVYSL